MSNSPLVKPRLWSPRKANSISCPDWMNGKALGAGKACECCKISSGKGLGIAGQHILGLLSALVDAAVAGIDEDEPADLALAGGFLAQPVLPPVSPGQVTTAPPPQVQAVPRNLIGKPGTAGAGAIVLIGFEVWKATQALESTLSLVQTVANAVPPIVATARRVADRSCEECVATKVWSQAKPQVRVDGPHRVRLG